MKPYFRKQIAIPQDHGSWVFVLSPLLIGIFAGGRFTLATLSLILGVMAAFLLRQPMTILVKAYAGRRPRSDLPAARFWMLVYGGTALLALAILVAEGFGALLYLAAPGLPVFAWHLWLVRRRAERRQAGTEIVATGVLSLSAPAAYWVGVAHYAPSGWWLWLLTWLQAAASIVYAYLRLEQRALPEVPPRSVQWKMGGRALLYTSFNLVLTLALGAWAVLPRLIFVPYLLQWLETLWGISHPALRTKPTAIGLRQLLISTFWTILFILFWVYS